MVRRASALRLTHGAAGRAPLARRGGAQRLGGRVPQAASGGAFAVWCLHSCRFRALLPRAFYAQLRGAGTWLGALSRASASAALRRPSATPSPRTAQLRRWLHLLTCCVILPSPLTPHPISLPTLRRSFPLQLTRHVSRRVRARRSYCRPAVTLAHRLSARRWILYVRAVLLTICTRRAAG
jgi:hypothetical protein